MTQAPDVHARPAHERDVDAVVDLIEEAQRATRTISRGGAMWWLHDTDRREATEQVRAVVSAAAATGPVLLVGTLDEVPVGYCLVHLDTLADGRCSGRLTDLWVTEGARSVGVGAELISSVLSWAAEHDCVGVDAWALPGERETKNFFEAAGFTARLLVVHRSLVGVLGAGPENLDD
jgi:GNAT superfamily N-acetyltransferase